LTKNIPKTTKIIVELLCDPTLTEAMKYYEEFSEFVLGFENDQKIEKVEEFKFLNYLIKYGDEKLTTMKKRQNGEKVEDEIFIVETTVEDSKTLEPSIKINFDIDEPEIKIESQQENQSTEAPSINFDLSPTDLNSETPSINWDIQVEAEDQPVVINWDDTNETSSSKTPVKLEVVSDDSILINNETRQRVANDLLKLKYFFLQRKNELGYSDHIISAAFQKSSTFLQRQSPELYNKYLEIIEKVLHSLKEKKFLELLEIKNNPRYVDRICATFERTLDCEEKSTKSIKFAQDKIDFYQNTVEESEPKYKILQEKANALKEKIQYSISKLFSNRPVNIIN